MENVEPNEKNETLVEVDLEMLELVVGGGDGAHDEPPRKP